MRDDAGRLQDILDAIQQIQERIGGGRQQFENDEMLQVWVVHHLQIIGEAARSISQALRVAHPEIPWASVIAMRNLLVHEYFGIDIEDGSDAGGTELRFQGAVFPARPSSAARACIALMQKSTCSSNGTPSSSAPATMSWRLTLRAKALSFIFFLTDAASTSKTLRFGLT